jgi:hypothetical protein
MKSRIFKAVLAVVAPLVIEFIVKKISEKLIKNHRKQSLRNFLHKIRSS